MNLKKSLFASFLLAALVSAADPGVSPGPGTRYATDAYPGFDREEEIVKPEKKTPRWFAFILGPKMSNATDQFAWARQCEADGSWGKARRAYDAVVRNWPASAEAPLAQKKVAEILLEKELDYEEAFAEYRYLLDFFSTSCDFKEISNLMYKVAELMRQEGKTIIFFRFKNTVDVRRAYESLVMRSPGASFVPEAMLTIAALREDEGKYEEAVKVYENLRNVYPESSQAKKALHSEARVRMLLIDEHGYNKIRARDTIDFLKLAMQSGVSEDVGRDLRQWLGEAETAIEAEAFRSAKFYDSNTRTRRSAINAYRQFLEDYPNGAHAEEARERLAKREAEEQEAAAKTAEKAAAEAEKAAAEKAEEEKK